MKVIRLHYLFDIFFKNWRDFIGSIFFSIRTAPFFRFFQKEFSERTLMSFDLHTSVSRDLEKTLISNGIDLDRWTISAHSHLFGEPNLRTAHIRGNNWKEINSKIILKFRVRYRYTLNRYSGFLISYTFSFLQIFESFGKPILAVNATRYESPHTLNKAHYESLNQCIQRLDKSNQLMVISNNLGDKDYLRLLSGIESLYIPSLCDHITKHNPQGFPWIIHSRNTELAESLAAALENAVAQHNAFPTGFNHNEFSKYAGVILVPYNISTMRLFELTTAGFPIRIPTDRLLKEWASLPGVLSELSWVQVFGAKCPDWLLNTPADPNWSKFLDWWLERADWNNQFYFPNVTRFDSVEELNIPPQPFLIKDIELRNEQIRLKWDEAVKLFLKN